MRILVTGRGTSGSFKVRGFQLGEAIGATVVANASQELIDRHDIVIVVKRASPDLLQRIGKKPLVYDVVDSWPQPLGNSWQRAQSIEWLKTQIWKIKPTAIVAATKAMASDCDFDVPVLALSHHSRPRMTVNPIRERVSKVGYEGSASYLGRWVKFLELECSARGWEFVLNPPNLSDLDIVVALRDVNGYPVRCWKSNVKLANAQGSGTPCIVGHEAGYKETESGGEHWADTQVDVKMAFDRLESQQARREASKLLLERAPRIEDVASTYRRWLAQNF